MGGGGGGWIQTEGALASTCSRGTALLLSGPLGDGLSPETSFISLLQAGETGLLSPTNELGLPCRGLNQPTFISVSLERQLGTKAEEPMEGNMACAGYAEESATQVVWPTQGGARTRGGPGGVGCWS